MSPEVKKRRKRSSSPEDLVFQPAFIDISAAHNCNKEVEKAERNALCLWIDPIRTLCYFTLESFNKFMILVANILNHRKIVFTSLLLFGIYNALLFIQGPHQQTLLSIRKKVMWWLWWIGLGFLSSCGFGTGLHTFVLYLGPFIAEVTLAAHECHTTKFPEPPYPEQIVCPDGSYPREELSIFTLIRKTELEAILWGLGTAIGELPPYFMAKSARLSGNVDEEDEELLEFEELVASFEKKQVDSIANMSFKEKTEHLLHKLIQKAGFLGILLCASIPNPLFDLAGMTCGHFLVPFWHFFGATFIGKALVKVHIQQIAIIALSSEFYIISMLKFLKSIPSVGNFLHAALLQYIEAQKDKLHHKTVETSAGWIPFIISSMVLLLMLGFVVSIIHAFARDYHRRMCKWKHIAEGEIKEQ